MDWAKLVAERAATSGVLNVDSLARELHISKAAVRTALSRQQRRGFVEHLGNKLFINRLTPAFSGRELINSLRPDSYLSLESVLRETGVSTQSPVLLTCVTSGRPGEFRTRLVSFRFRRIAPHLFWGFHQKRTRYGTYHLAEPEKALLDWIYLLRQEGSPVPTDELNLRPLDLSKFLEYAKKFPRPVRQQALELSARFNADANPKPSPPREPVLSAG